MDLIGQKLVFSDCLSYIFFNAFTSCCRPRRSSDGDAPHRSHFCNFAYASPAVPNPFQSHPPRRLRIIARAGERVVQTKLTQRARHARVFAALPAALPCERSTTGRDTGRLVVNERSSRLSAPERGFSLPLSLSLLATDTETGNETGPSGGDAAVA